MRITVEKKHRKKVPIQQNFLF